jgi:acyl-CoA synthetase (AMP-forming)/AMP-acid ligase II
MKNMDSIVIFTSLTFVKYFDEISNDFVNNNNKKLQIKSVVVLDGSYNNYSTFEQLLREGNNQTLKRIPHFDIEPKNDIFLILRSSGTTGLPKSVLISHFAFVTSFLKAIKRYESLSIKDFIISLPFAAGNRLALQYLPLLSTGALIVVYKELDLKFLLESVEKYKITFLPINPSFGDKLIKGDLVDKYDLSSIKVMLTGGAAFPANVAKAIVDKYNIIFIQGIEY